MRRKKVLKRTPTEMLSLIEFAIETLSGQSFILHTCNQRVRPMPNLSQLASECQVADSNDVGHYARKGLFMLLGYDERAAGLLVPILSLQSLFGCVIVCVPNDFLLIGGNLQLGQSGGLTPSAV